jgi:hypothetical protein
MAPTMKYVAAVALLMSSVSAIPLVHQSLVWSTDLVNRKLIIFRTLSTTSSAETKPLC